MASTKSIADKVISAMNRQLRGKVTDLRQVLAGREAAAQLQKTVATPERLVDFHPAHAAYVIAQNQMSVMSEQLTTLDALRPFAELIGRAEDDYQPGGPPVSPLTTSYFTCWAFFDACHGGADETIGKIAIQVGREFGMHPELLRLFQLMQDSRMGLYVHRGHRGGLTLLRELVTGVEHEAVVPSGHVGVAGELWYARVLPSPVAALTESVVFTTPYVLVQPGLDAWGSYFERTLGSDDGQRRTERYARHLKYGPSRSFWNEFVFEAYVNFRTEVVFLAGLPDVPASRPQSAVNQR